MAGSYRTFELVWQERTISVSFQANWLNSSHWHIELRCADPLPVTETGYRSYFVPSNDDAEKADVAELVTHWLNTAAECDAWQQYLDACRQPDLFR